MKLLTHNDFDHQADYEDKYFLTFAISHYTLSKWKKISASLYQTRKTICKLERGSGGYGHW